MSRVAVIADSGFVVSLLNRRDRFHSESLQLYSQYSAILLPQPVLTEAAYLLNRDDNIMRVVQLLRSFRDSRFNVVALEQSDFDRVADILEQYRDSRIDFVDACVMAVAERWNIHSVLTLDRRDFGLFRPRHCESFEILP